MNSLKITMVLVVSFLFVGCGMIDRFLTGWTGSLTYKCSKSGVEYVQSDSGLAVHVYPETGMPVKCDRWKGYN